MTSYLMQLESNLESLNFKANKLRSRLLNLVAVGLSPHSLSYMKCE